MPAMMSNMPAIFRVSRDSSKKISAPAVTATKVRLTLQVPFDIGVVLYAFASIVWFRVIATEPLSIAYPVLVSLTFVAVTAGALIFFDESLDTRKIAGMLLIIVGVYLVSQGPA